MALGSLVWLLATLHIAGGLKLDDHCGPFQPRPFCDSMIHRKEIFKKQTKYKSFTYYDYLIALGDKEQT